MTLRCKLNRKKFFEETGKIQATNEIKNDYHNDLPVKLGPEVNLKD